MATFGYSLTPSSRIDLCKFNQEKWNRLVELEPDVLKCMACGSCTASCTAGKFTRTSLRSAILYIQNGQEKQALELVPCDPEARDPDVLMHGRRNRADHPAVAVAAADLLADGFCLFAIP